MNRTGTTYHADTLQAVEDVLEQVRESGERVRIFYGSPMFGTAWPEENEMIGTISRSTGDQKVPLLLPRKDSLGGSSILEHCIVAIKTRDRWLYKHPKFETGEFEYRMQYTLLEHFHWVFFNGQKHARFETREAAERYCKFMTGERFGR